MTGQLDLISERVPPAGGFQGSGIERLLGAPRMDDLTLLVREAVQNSWDARHPSQSAGTVDFSMRVFTLNDSQRGHLTTLLKDVPKSATRLRDLLRRSQIRVLEVRDTGTTGLNGPTRADVAAPSSRNFVDFVRNIGSPQDREVSGGTYGFGKGSYYRVSEAKAILIHTRCIGDNGRPESRFIAAALGDPFTRGASQFTGRHFWGTADKRNDLVEPLFGVDADRAAKSVGMGVPKGSTGTSILVLGLRNDLEEARTDSREVPELPDDHTTALITARRIAHQLVWQCWPKMVEVNTPTGTVVPMRFAVECEGSAVEVPGLGAIPSIRSFVNALRAAREGSDGVTLIASRNPRRTLGRLAIKRFQATRPARGFGSEESSGFDVPTHHVALLRAPELVVRYLAGPSSDLADHGWAGVFVADALVDPSFAAAEPPSHDDWIPESVKDSGMRRDVNVALRRIKDAVDQEFAPPTSTVAASTVSVADLSSKLGQTFLMPGHDARRTPEGRPAQPRDPIHRQRNNVHYAALRSARLDRIDNTPVHLIEVERIPGAKFRADVGVTIDDSSAEATPPEGSIRPEVLGWYVDGALLTAGTELPACPSEGCVELAIQQHSALLPRVQVKVVG